jgi:hypothetical protein
MNFPAALPHGDIKEVFDNVFFVTGTMRNEFFGSTWQFSRNMTVVRENGRLTLINSVRLNDAGLAELDALGKVTNVVQLGDMHGLDDQFYLDRYCTNHWVLPGMGVAEDSMVIAEGAEGSLVTAEGSTAATTINKTLAVDGEMPFSDCSLFIFETTNRPESILRLDREGGIMIACDALQNWGEPDEFFDTETIEKMREMGFFAHAGVGPAWIHASEPKPEDFERLSKINFNHALCGHGTPVKNTAQADFAKTFNRMFGITI